jgi:hypothetical protein
MLPEVARDEEILQGEYGEAEDEPASPPAERIRPQSGMRRVSSTSNPRVSGRGTQGRRGGPAPAAKKSNAKKSNNALVIGIVVGIVVLLAVLAAAGGSKPKAKPPSSSTKPTTQPEAESEDTSLEQQCRAYIGAVNAGVDRNIMRYYSYDSEGERAVRRAVSGLIETSTRYDGVTFKSVSAATGMVTFAYTGGERTLAWKKVDGVWLIVEK